MDTKTDQSLEQLYRETFPSVARVVARLGGDLDAAKDIFHDALIIYIEKLRAHILSTNAHNPDSHVNNLGTHAHNPDSNAHILSTNAPDSNAHIVSTNAPDGNAHNFDAHNIGIKTSPQAYLTGIAKILWIRKFNQQLRHTSFEDLSEELDIPKDFYETEQTIPRPILSYLEAAGKKCLELLQAFYYEEQSIQEITEKFRYKTRHSATVQKHKCLEKVRNQLKTSAAYEEAIA